MALAEIHSSSGHNDPAHADLLLFEGDTRPRGNGRRRYRHLDRVARREPGHATPLTTSVFRTLGAVSARARRFRGLRRR